MRDNTPGLATSSDLKNCFLCISLRPYFVGEKLHSNLSRLAMVVWLFAALVLTSNYTATLSSMLTVHRLEPSLVNVDSLKSSNAVVGCNNGSVVGKYLETALGFQHKNIKLFSSGDDYYQALKNGSIQAAFLRTPYANLLLSKYCTELISTGPIFHVGGLGFVSTYMDHFSSFELLNWITFNLDILK